MSDAREFDRDAFRIFWNEFREMTTSERLEKMSPEEVAEIMNEFSRRYSSFTSPRPNDASVGTRDAPQLNRQVFRQRLDEFLDRMTTEKLRKMSPEELAETMWEYNRFIAQRPKDAEELTAEQLGLRTFFEQLIQRQAGIEPDYRALYSKKAELDRKFFGRDTLSDPR